MHARAYVIPCPWHSRSKLCTWPAQSSLREIQAHGKMLDDGWPFTCLAKSIGKRIRTLPTRRIGYPSTRVPPSNIAHARFETCKCKDRGATLNKTKGTMALECCSPWHRLTGPPAPPAPPCRSLRRGGPSLQAHLPRERTRKPAKRYERHQRRRRSKHCRPFAPEHCGLEVACQMARTDDPSHTWREARHPPPPSRYPVVIITCVRYLRPPGHSPSQILGTFSRFSGDFLGRERDP